MDEAGGATTRPPRDTARFFNDTDLVSMYHQFTRSLDAPDIPMNRWLDRHMGSGRRALDVGCGTGRHTVTLADRYDDVVAVDVAPVMIEFAERDRSRPNIHYQIRDVLTMTPECDGRFDLVLALGCVVNVGPPALVLGHLRRLVAKGGTLLLMEPMWEPGWGSRNWQVDFAFRTARAVWEGSGDLDDVTAALQVVLHPTWLKMSGVGVPLAREDFLREYSAALPGATIEEEFERLGLGIFAVSWRAEDEWS
jgi:SAM-dependent methyltransferase